MPAGDERHAHPGQIRLLDDPDLFFRCPPPPALNTGKGLDIVVTPSRTVSQSRRQSYASLLSKSGAVSGRLGAPYGLPEAIRYALSHWDGLCHFLADGRVEPDSNIAQRSI